MYLGNKLDTSTFRKGNQSWVVTDYPNCLACPNNGAFDKLDCIDNLSVSSIFSEKPHEFSNNVNYLLIPKDKVWIYYNYLNKDHECSESAAFIKDKYLNSSFSNSIKIANKIIKNIEDFQINYSSTPNDIKPITA